MEIKKILISQAQPMNPAPYNELKEKFGVEMDFHPFFLIEPVTSREFRAEHVNILDYTAIVFSARHTIDAFFDLCDELRVKVPETMKYFCTTEAVAVYLQKHIIYRKRKIFFGDGTPQSVLDQIGTKHKGEKFLVTTTDSNNGTLSTLFEQSGLDYKTAVFVKSVPQDLKSLPINTYDLLVIYNPFDLASLQANFPELDLKSLKFITYGKQVAKAMDEAGVPVEIKAPTPEATSVAKALSIYLSGK